MNDLINRILDLRREQKLVLLAGMAVLLLALDYFYLYGPQSERISRLKDDILNTRIERDRKRALVSNLPQLRKQTRELNGRLMEAMAQLPDRKEIPDLLTSISNKAKEAGLDILIFRPKSENFQDFYAEIPVDIVVKGGFHSVVTFFDEVGRLERLVNISNIELKGVKLKEDRVLAETSAMATTFRFLDDAERKKIAAEKAKAAKAAKK